MATMANLVLSPIVSLSCMGQSMGNGKFILQSCWSIVSYGRGYGKSLIVLHFPI
jgi:hypothetical protein